MREKNKHARWDGVGGERISKKRTNFPKIMTYISPTLLFSIQTHLLHKKHLKINFH